MSFGGRFLLKGWQIKIELYFIFEKLKACINVDVIAKIDFSNYLGKS